MGAAKWIGGIIGFMAGGPLGALAGFVFGSLFDTDSNDAGSYYGEAPTRGTTYTGQRFHSFGGLKLNVRKNQKKCK